MGNRLSKIYTKTGDAGETGLSDGSRVKKDHVRIEAIGEIDELNSAIGVLLSYDLEADVQSLLHKIQNHCFNLGGELSLPGKELIDSTHIQLLETALDQINAQLKPLKEFILPGGTPAASYCHLVRAMCRRAERRAITLSNQEPVSKYILIYLNRLSDLFFVLARHINKSANQPESLWQSERINLATE